MTEENIIQVKDKTIDISKVKRLTVINCPVYSEFSIYVTDFKEQISEIIDLDNEEQLRKNYKAIYSKLNDYVAKSTNKVLISYENLDLDNQCEVICVNEVENMYIQTAKDSLHNRLGYSLYLIDENGDKSAFFFEKHIDAERYFHQIDNKKIECKGREI